MEIRNPNTVPSPLSVTQRMNELRRQGVLLSELMSPSESNPPVIDLELVTDDGTITLEPIVDDSGAKNANEFMVLDSSDSSMSAGDSVFIDGASLASTTTISDIIGPGARVGFRKAKVRMYPVVATGTKKQGIMDRRLTDKIIKNAKGEIQEIIHISDNGETVTQTNFTTPGFTGVLQHAAVTQRIGEEEKSRYLF